MDVTPIINASALVYEMIAEGRDRPVENTVALPEDKDTLIALWIAQTKPSEGFQAAVSTNNWQHPDYCAASISLQEIIISDRSDATLRFLVDTTATALAQ